MSTATTTRTVKTKSFVHGKGSLATAARRVSKLATSESKAVQSSAQKAFQLGSERFKEQGELKMIRRAIDSGRLRTASIRKSGKRRREGHPAS